jgi:UDP-GlcNAc:undecaprenyl-phosphate GlcNAc-1-phosphate transferase
MLLGLLLAYGPISSTATLDPSILKNTLNRFPTILPILLPAAIFIIPYADLLLAVARRARAGQSPFAPDKKHLHHRLLNIGHSHRKSVLIMYLWAALFAVTVVSLSVVRTKLLILAGVTLAGMLILLLVSVPRLRPHRRVRPAVGSAAGPLVVNAAGTTAAGPAVPVGSPGTAGAATVPGWPPASDAGRPARPDAARPVGPDVGAPVRPGADRLEPPGADRSAAPGSRPAAPGSRPAAPGSRPAVRRGHPGTGSPP